MGRIAVAACILGFLAVAASAHTPQKPLSASGGKTELEAELSAEEAFQVGWMLLDVAHDVEQEDEPKGVTDEYFLKKIFGKSKNATKNFAGGLKEKLKNYVNKTASAVKVAAKELAVELANEAKQRVKQKAYQILLDILKNAEASYAVEDSETNVDVMKHLSTRIRHTGLALIERSKERRSHGASR